MGDSCRAGSSLCWQAADQWRNWSGAMYVSLCDNPKQTWGLQVKDWLSIGIAVWKRKLRERETVSVSYDTLRCIYIYYIVVFPDKSAKIHIWYDGCMIWATLQSCCPNWGPEPLWQRPDHCLSWSIPFISGWGGRGGRSSVDVASSVRPNLGAGLPKVRRGSKGRPQGAGSVELDVQK